MLEQLCASNPNSIYHANIMYHTQRQIYFINVNKSKEMCQYILGTINT